MSENEASLFRIEPTRSRLTVQAFAGGLFSVFAHNPKFSIRNFEGEARLFPDTLKGASLRLAIKAESLELIDDMSAKDRQEIERMMREDVLEINKHPEIVFESSDISGDQTAAGQYKVRIAGDLSMHGVARKCSFAAQVWASGAMMRSHGETAIKQTDFNIKLVSAAGGTIKVKDELKLSFDILANKSQ
jgi:polyisoprenoid-binding protein YceI